jgi:competence protein ComEA
VANIFFQPIPINRADKDILTSLPGIGPVLAERIMQRRNQHGFFKSKDELLQVTGIGPKKFAALVDNITLD